MKLISKEVSPAELEYMNIHPPISVLATALGKTRIAVLMEDLIFAQMSTNINDEFIELYYSNEFPNLSRH